MAALDYLKVVKARRSFYNLTKASPIGKDKIVQIVKDAILHTPTSFNAQSGRVLVLFDADHDKLWDGVKTLLKPLVTAEQYPATEGKVNNCFKAGYGTVLFFEDQRDVIDLQKRFPSYQDRFPQWSDMSSGILQHVVWSAFGAEGLGASLQHYNPVIDEFVKINWKIDEHWRLLAQMPFGTPSGPPGEKTFKDIESRIKVVGA